MVCVEQPLDFVKDLTAVMFITMLDNVDQSKDLTEMIVKLKFSLLTRENGEPTTWSYIKNVLTFGRVDVKYVRNTWGPEGPLTKEEKAYVFDEDNESKFEKISDKMPEKWGKFLGERPEISASTKEELLRMKCELSELKQTVAQLSDLKQTAAELEKPRPKTDSDVGDP
mmetsp:Transcript_39596/g.123362  ORF Transcript_39596/g.123362 Transcript_39596/m.123362 type:complete len:169 (-) Transcript_39596:331-837(-)